MEGGGPAVVYFTHDNGGTPFRVEAAPGPDGLFEVRVARNQREADEAAAWAAGAPARRRLAAEAAEQGLPPPGPRAITVAELLAQLAQLSPAGSDGGGPDDDVVDDGDDGGAAPPEPEGRANWPGTLEAAAPAGPAGRAPGAEAAEAAAWARDAATSAARDAAARADGLWAPPPAGLRLRAREVLVGRSRAGWPGAAHPDPERDGEVAGNTLLLRLDPADVPGGWDGGGVPYAFVGGDSVRLLSFPEPVTAFYSPLGNSDVPYPVAVTPSWVVALWSGVQVLPRAAFGPAPAVGDFIAQAPFLAAGPQAPLPDAGPPGPRPDAGVRVAGVLYRAGALGADAEVAGAATV
jgi:hypothetical protein